MRILKTLTAMFALTLSIGLFSFTNPVEPTTKIDTTESVITWKGYKVTGSHAGTLKLNEGAFEYADGLLEGGAFTIDMTSLNCTDLEGESKGSLEGHLKSADFFGIEKFPTASFIITKVSAKGTPGDYKVVGDLTIKGITKEVKFYTNVVSTDKAQIATADIKIDRTDFDIRYGSGSFFDSLGDKTIYDEFDLTVKIVSAKIVPAK
ncbi:MAG: polyisoprenoid-binding protein YceI [Ulvibacter sp.]|jgi:polyisoprenoid-binding protein YceI